MKTYFAHPNVLALTVIMAISLFVSAAVSETPSDSPAFNGWAVVGPGGGDVRAVTVDPRDQNRLYITTLDGQVHTSPDGGKTWQFLVNFNRALLVLDNILVDARDSKIIYTSGHRHREPGGFFKSIDGGTTWKESKDLSKEPIYSLTQSASKPEMMLAGTKDGVWISMDSGDNWKKVDSSTMPTDIDSLAIDPENTNIIYAGTTWRAFKTTDAGKNWHVIKDGMIDDSDVFAIDIDDKKPDHVIASACSGIYESYNKGEKWTKIQGIPSTSRRTRDIRMNPTLNGAIYAATTEGFWMSTNGGKGWALTTSRDLEINSIAVHPDAPNKIFIATNNYGVMVSEDGGKNFRQTNGNFTSRFMLNVVPDVQNSNRLYATTHNTATGGGFFFISDDGGRTWLPAMKGLIANRISPYAILQDRSNPNLIYLGTNVGLFSSPDRGLSWNQLTPPKPKPVVRKTAPKRRPGAKGKTAPRKNSSTDGAPNTDESNVAADVPNAEGLYPALVDQVNVLFRTEDGRNGVIAGTDKGLFRSYDVSKGWEKISLGAAGGDKVFAGFILPSQPDTIWIGTAVSGLVVSHDGGKTWYASSGVPTNAPISAIIADPKRPDTIFVGTTQTLYVSRDGGQSWTRRGGNLPLGNYASILINPRNSDEVFVASALENNGGIYQSVDAGKNWKRVDSKESNLPSRRVWSMIFDPSDPNRIFAGTHSSGIYRIDRAASTADTVTRPRVTTTGN
jgi:photosystem II stability/assembly factor-like uncharacterized protein